MKTVEQIVTYKQKSLDGRDVERLGDFVPEDQLGENTMDALHARGFCDGG